MQSEITAELGDFLDRRGVQAQPERPGEIVGQQERGRGGSPFGRRRADTRRPAQPRPLEQQRRRPLQHRRVLHPPGQPVARPRRNPRARPRPRRRPRPGIPSASFSASCGVTRLENARVGRVVAPVLAPASRGGANRRHRRALQDRAAGQRGARGGRAHGAHPTGPGGSHRQLTVQARHHGGAARVRYRPLPGEHRLPGRERREQAAPPGRGSGHCGCSADRCAPRRARGPGSRAPPAEPCAMPGLLRTRDRA